MKSAILNLLFTVFFILPSWAQDGTFKFEVVNSSRLRKADNDMSLDRGLKIGVALDLTQKETALDKLPRSVHQLPIPPVYPYKPENRNVEIGKGKSIRRLSVIVYREDEDGLGIDDCLGCCSDRPPLQKAISSVSTKLPEKYLRNATVLIDFQGFEFEKPQFNVYILYDPDASSKNAPRRTLFSFKRAMNGVLGFARDIRDVLAEGIQEDFLCCGMITNKYLRVSDR